MARWFALTTVQAVNTLAVEALVVFPVLLVRLQSLEPLHAHAVALTEPLVSVMVLFVIRLSLMSVSSTCSSAAVVAAD